MTRMGDQVNDRNDMSFFWGGVVVLVIYTLEGPADLGRAMYILNTACVYLQISFSHA